MNRKTTGDDLVIYIYKNGSVEKLRLYEAQTASDMVAISALLEANGTTDYFEIFAQNSGRDTADVASASDVHFFEGSWQGI